MLAPRVTEVEHRWVRRNGERILQTRVQKEVHTYGDPSHPLFGAAAVDIDLVWSDWEDVQEVGI